MSEMDEAAVEMATLIDQGINIGFIPSLVCIPGQHQVRIDGHDMVATMSGNPPFGWEVLPADTEENDEWFIPRAKYNPNAESKVACCPAHIECFKRGGPCVSI